MDGSFFQGGLISVSNTGLLSLYVLIPQLCASLPSPAAAQGVGAIGGTLSDSSGAVLPGVTVSLVSPGTIGGNQEVVTNERGSYQCTRLIPGRYGVKAELAGFRRAVQDDIEHNLQNALKSRRSKPAGTRRLQ